MNTTTVVFDLDGTLIDIDSAQAWLSFLIEQNVTNAPITDRVCSELMKHYDSGSMDMNQYMAAWLLPLDGMNLQKLGLLIDRFIKRVIQPKIYPDALSTIRWHQAQGHHIAIISASPEIIVKPIAAHLNVEQAMGIKVELQNNKISQIALPPFTFKEGKVTVTKQWLQQVNVTELNYAYSDSINDLALLEFANLATCINPCQNLSNLAKQNNWPIHNWNLAKCP